MQCFPFNCTNQSTEDLASNRGHLEAAYPFWSFGKGCPETVQSNPITGWFLQEEMKCSPLEVLTPFHPPTGFWFGGWNLDCVHGIEGVEGGALLPVRRQNSGSEGEREGSSISLSLLPVSLHLAASSSQVSRLFSTFTQNRGWTLSIGGLKSHQARATSKAESLRTVWLWCSHVFPLVPLSPPTHISAHPHKVPEIRAGVGTACPSQSLHPGDLRWSLQSSLPTSP